MHPNRLAIAALSFAIAMPRAWATDAALAKDFDLHRRGWLPSDAHEAGEGLPDPGVNAVAVLPDGQA